MPTRKEENYKLLHHQNESGSSETLHDFHSPRSDSKSGFSLSHCLTATVKTRTLFVLLLVISGTVNLLLAALVTRLAFYTRTTQLSVIGSETSNVSPYGSATSALMVVKRAPSANFHQLSFVPTHLLRFLTQVDTDLKLQTIVSWMTDGRASISIQAS